MYDLLVIGATSYIPCYSCSWLLMEKCALFKQGQGKSQLKNFFYASYTAAMSMSFVYTLQCIIVDFTF